MQGVTWLILSSPAAGAVNPCVEVACNLPKFTYLYPYLYPLKELSLVANQPRKNPDLLHRSLQPLPGSGRAPPCPPPPHNGQIKA